MEYIGTTETGLMLSIQERDYKIQLCQAELALIPKKIQAEEDKYAKSEKEWRKCYDALKAVQLRQREAELKAGEMDAAIEKYQIQSQSVKDNESYKAMLAQIDYARQKKDEAETNALMLLDEIEQAAKEEQAEKKKLIQHEKDKNAAIGTLEKRKAELLAMIDNTQQEKLSLAEQVHDKAVFDRYEEIRKKGKRVIFKVRDSANPAEKAICPSCNMMLTQHFSGLLRKPDLFVICPECGAWLCLEEIAG